MLANLQRRDSSLRQPSPDVPFAAMTLNLGPRTVTKAHRDSSNYAAGLCLVLALGSFDAVRGGQLILHEAKLIVDLPAGAFVLFPSAMITHENIPLANKSDTRMSVTAYSAGALWRFADQGYTTLSQCRRAKTLIKRKAEGRIRWKKACSLFPRINSQELSTKK
jgi:hypothetical protein